MNFAGMNPVAIAPAAVAALLWSALFLRFSGGAVRRVGPAGSAAGTMLTLLVAEGVVAWVLAGTLGHLGAGQVTLRNGLISALFVWAGFVVPPLGVSCRLRGESWGAALSDAGHWLVALLLMGAVIGGIGV